MNDSWEFIGWGLNAVSALAALGSAFCWGKVARVKVPNIELTLDRTNFNDVTHPLAKQGLYNQWGAGFAVCAAVPQVIKLFLDI